MAYDDEKKEREKIRKKIREKKRKKEDLKDNKEKLEKNNDKLKEKIKCANENIEHFDQKKKYEVLIKATSDAKKYLTNASTEINNSYKTYKKYFQGNAASLKIPTYSNTISKIAREKRNLESIFSAASGGKSAQIAMIKKNNSKMGRTTNSIADCNRFIKECEATISDNKRIIGDYNNRIHDLEKDIDRLQRKL